jgi:hypothetical protein
MATIGSRGIFQYQTAEFVAEPPADVVFDTRLPGRPLGTYLP